jgi:hypothetical protein
MTADETGAASDDNSTHNLVVIDTASPRQSHARDDKSYCFLVKTCKNKNNK